MIFLKLNLLISIIFLVVAVSTASSQNLPVSTFTVDAVREYLGFSVSGAGDVNNDGFDDLIVGAYSGEDCESRTGRAYVYSGQSGVLLYTFTGEAAGDIFGLSVSGAGDVNNDGFDDLIVGAYLNDAGGSNAGRAYVYSGQSGALLYTFTGEAADDRFGWSISCAGDVNKDGFDDLIVGASLNDAGGFRVGRAYVYSGQSGVLLYTFTGEAEEDGFGVSVSGAGDVNKDGFDDLIVGASLNDAGGSRAGRAYVYSGQSGTLLHTFTGDAAADRFHSVSGAGDVNNDGFDDLIVGAYGINADGSYVGRAYVFSGQSGDTVYVFTGEASHDFFGGSIASAGDVDNDGFDDLIVGAFGNDAGGLDAGRAYVYSGQSGTLLHTFTGEVALYRFGVSVSGAGDVNNDGFDDLIVGGYLITAAGFDAGWAYVYSGQSGTLLWRLQR